MICKRSMRGLAIVLAMVFAAAPVWAADGGDFSSTADKHAYALGMDLGKKVQEMDGELDLTILLEGFSDVLEGRDTKLADDEVFALVQDFRTQMAKKRRAEAASASERNLKEGKVFLEANKKKDGVMVTDSGLQYMVITPGEGENPGITDEVTVHYRGTLLDGREFDSSYKRGKPATFRLNQVIAGWTEGVQLMKPGAKYKFFIPSELAYGSSQAGQLITPNSTLIFEVELLEVN